MSDTSGLRGNITNRQKDGKMIEDNYMHLNKEGFSVLGII